MWANYIKFKKTEHVKCDDDDDVYLIKITTWQWIDIVQHI
jgi:hypothetical protein